MRGRSGRTRRALCNDPLTGKDRPPKGVKFNVAKRFAVGFRCPKLWARAREKLLDGESIISFTSRPISV